MLLDVILWGFMTFRGVGRHFGVKTYPYGSVHLILVTDYFHFPEIRCWTTPIFPFLGSPKKKVLAFGPLLFPLLNLLPGLDSRNGPGEPCNIIFLIWLKGAIILRGVRTHSIVDF